MTSFVLSIRFGKFRLPHSKRYDTYEVERQYVEQVSDLPYGATVRLYTGGLPPIPDNLGWHRYGINYVIESSDAITARLWASMLNQHLDAIAGRTLESWGA